MTEKNMFYPIRSEDFGSLSGGREVTIFRMMNAHGIQVSILNYGGIIQSIQIPDRYGNVHDIVLGFDSLEGYVHNPNYHGALVGRYANRIAGGSFRINGHNYTLPKNSGEHCLHGGNSGFNQVIWDASIILEDGQESLRLRHTSPDGDQGFPGELKVTADFRLTDSNELVVKMTASTDKPTVVSLTLHPYFNLTGDTEKSILGHRIRMPSEQYLPVTDSLKPIGSLENVQGTPFDLRQARTLESALGTHHEQVAITHGFDHCFVSPHPGDPASCLGFIYDPVSGRGLKVFSDAPGVQLYTGNHLNSSMIGKGNKPFSPWGGVCLEPQEFPNAPNEPGFGYAPLQPSEQYEHTITFQFSSGAESC